MDENLHLHAADGYLKTGATTDLDGKQDREIVREAGGFWRSLKMREKVDKIVALVRADARAGRLKWTYNDVHSLIKPYPKHECDKVLANIGDCNDLELEEGERPFEQEQDYTIEDCLKDLEEHNSEVAESTLSTINTDVAVLEPTEEVLHDEDVIQRLNRSIADLQEVGYLSAATNLINERHKAHRRQRLALREKPETTLALEEVRMQTAR